jgi:hypothetical protein
MRSSILRDIGLNLVIIEIFMQKFLVVLFACCINLDASTSSAQDSEPEETITETTPANGTKPKAKPKSDASTTPIRAPKAKTTDSSFARDTLAVTPSETSWWSPKGMQHSIGVELSDSNFGVLGTDAIAYGFALEKFGVDLYFAYTKDSNSATVNVTQSSNELSNPKSMTVTQRFSGTENPKKTTLGIQPKYFFFSDRWFKASIGFLFAQTPKTSVRYKTGSVTTIYSDTSNMSTYSVSESSLGSTSSSVDAKLSYGPRINVEFYLKWFPHIGLGFGTGLIQTSGGDVKNSTSTQTRSYVVTNGVAATPTSAQTSVTTDTTKTGGTSKTIAVGGTKFNLMGNFAIRYIW